jgi:thiol-disulfide isomerase/thioredoxin
VAPAGRSSSRLWLGLFLIVVAAGVVALLASRGQDKSGPTRARTTGATTGSTVVAPAETRPVEVTGTALPRYEGEPDPAVGRPIAEITGAGFDGAPVTIAPDGRPKLVLFVAHWCPHCQREVPKLSEYLRQHPLPADVDMVTVATGTSPDRPNYPPSGWLAREKWPGSVLADSTQSTAASAFGLSAYPFFVAVDASGKVVARTSGELTTETFAQLMQAARGS